MSLRRAGVTVTQTWTTANSLDTKVELEDKLAKGLKAELLGSFVPHSQAYSAKTNLHFRQPSLHGRLFLDLTKGPTAVADAVVAHQGWMAGAEAGYDVQKAAVTRYAAAVGYAGSQYSATVQAANNLSVFSAAYYHKVNSEVEAGAKAVWDSKAGNNVGLEVASKYRLDPTSFLKVRSLFVLTLISSSKEYVIPMTCKCAGQDQRPWCRRSRLQRHPPPGSHAGPGRVVRHAEAQ